jgi:hypothetical protein
MKDKEKEAFDLALKQELEKRINQIQAEIAQNLQTTIQQSLVHLEDSQRKLEEERKKLEAKKDELHARLKDISARADKMAEEWFQKRTHEITNSIRKEQIRDLIYHHLQHGKPVEDICDWLQVERKMVEDIIVLMDRKVDYKKEQFMKGRIQLSHNPRLQYKNSGRSGSIIFQNDLSSFELWWEFGGGNALVIIDIPTEHDWIKITGLPLDQRSDTLRFIAEQVIEDQTSSAHKYEISDRWITIFR